MRSDRTDLPQHGKHATPVFLASIIAQPAGAGWRPRRIAWIGATICLVVLGGPSALADEAPDLLADPLMLSLGTFILDTDTRVRLDGDDGLGTQIDWEEDIGSGEATRIRFDGTWRFTERNKLRALWFSNSVSRSTRLEEDISWGDVVYPASVEVGTDFEFDVFELAYERSLLLRDRYELSGTIGLHYTELTLAIEGEGTIDGESVAGRVRESGSVNAPLPVIGLRGLWRLTGPFWLDASAQFFYLSIDDYQGSLQDYRVAALWQPRRWMGIGIGYSQFTFDVDVEKEGFNGSLDWTYRGPLVFYSASF